MSETQTSPRARDIMIRALHSRRHELLDLERNGGLPPELERELSDVLARIDKLEMDEFNERERPHWDERFRQLKAIADRMRPLLTPESQAQLDAVFAEKPE